MAAGLMAMIRKSGGISAVAQRVSLMSGSIIGQLVVLGAGIVLFFDPYASIVVNRGTCFDYQPFSTSAGLGSSLIQTQVDRLEDLGFQKLTVPSDGWSVFARSIKYQFYPIFLLFFVTAMAMTRRDLGPMLFAERERWLLVLVGEMPKWTFKERCHGLKETRPFVVTTCGSHQFCGLPPSVLRSVLSLTLHRQQPKKILQYTNAWSLEDFMAQIIYTTMGVVTLTPVFFMVQRKHVVHDEQEREDPEEIREMPGRRPKKHCTNDVAGYQESPAVEVSVEKEVSRSSHVSAQEGAECFLKGGAAVTPVLKTLTLAWATAEVFLELGMDRLFADLVNLGDFRVESYPTLGFTASFVLAMASNGNAELFYALVGGVMSGSVVGDHSSSIFCYLRDHMVTPIPYILFVAVLSVLVGHFPSASGNFPWYSCYIFGLGLSSLHPEGKFDFITERFFVQRSLLLKEQQEAILSENDDKKAVIDTDSGSISDLEVVSADFVQRELDGLVRKATGNSVHTPMDASHCR